MQGVTREQIYVALFQLLGGITFTLPDNTATTFVTVLRKFMPWADLSVEQQPAIMQIQKAEMAERNGKGLPVRWRLLVDLVVYVKTSGDRQDATPVQYLNAIMDALEATFPLENVSQVQTLGGLVDRVQISGKVEFDEGLLGTQGWMVVPIEILTPA